METVISRSAPQREGLGDALAAAGGGTDLESVTRPLLEALQVLTGLSSTYLTTIDWEHGQQQIRYALNTGSITISEGLDVDWTDTLCRRALESGDVCTDAVPEIWGDSQTAAELGIQTYVSSPIMLPDGRIYGTLCGASADRLAVGQDTSNLLQLFSRIISDAIGRERARQASEARALDAEDRLRSRAHFLAMAEHKLQTPMTVVVGWARSLQSGRLDADLAAKAVDAIVEHSQRVSSQITELLDEASSQVVASDMELEHVELQPFLQGVASALGCLSAQHPIAVEVTSGLCVTSDRRALRIAIEHLVENAVKYSPDGGRVTLAGQVTDAGRVAVSVCDEGPGIPEDVDIFAPFVRGHGSTIPGTGIGLHIVSSLVHAMNGDVKATRRGPTGSEFTMSLPA